MSRPGTRLGSIAFIPDDRLSRERSAILGRAINSMRHYVKVDTLPSSLSEEDMIEKLQNNSYLLILVPWYRYFAWSKVEAFYGLTRTSGPTFAGYFCEAIQPYEIGDQADHLRSILLDFCYLQTSEIVLLLKSLITESKRTGIRPLLDPHTSIYIENWYSGQGQGTRADVVLSLPELSKSQWKKRTSALRICLSALWSLVYEEGPGKSEAAQTHQADTPKAYFQVAVDQNCLVLRIIYTMNSWTPKNTLTYFWPNATQPISPAQFLLRYADFIKVHSIVETNDIEIIVGFLPSAPSEKAFGKIHTHWVEPISASLVSEIPFETPSPNAPHLKYLPIQSTKPETQPIQKNEAQSTAKDRFIADAATKIRQLTLLIQEKDTIIQELRSGGVGEPKPPLLAPEILLEQFQEQYFQTRLDIKQFESQIELLTLQGASEEQISELNQKMLLLLERERDWIKRILPVLETFRASKKNIKTGT